MKVRHITICLFLFLSTFIGLEAQVVRFLNKDWKVYDKVSHQLYDQPLERKLPAHLYLNEERDKGLYLSLPSTENVSVYINNAFHSEIPKKGTLVLNVDSIFALGKQKHALISVYGPFNKCLVDSASLLPSKSPFKQKHHKEYFPFAVRDFGKSYFALLFLSCLSLFSLVYNIYPKSFGQYFNLTDLFLNFKVDNLYMRSSLEGHYLASSLLSCFFFGLAGVGLPFFSNEAEHRSFWSFASSLSYFLLLGIFFYLLKYLVTQLAAWFFSLEKHATLHYKIFVRISVLWSIVLAALAVLNQSILTEKWLMPFFAFFSLFFLTLISIKVSVLINRVARVSTLYLISYLCITEWLPYFVILKLYEKYFS